MKDYWIIMLWLSSMLGGASMVFAYLFGKNDTLSSLIALIISATLTIVLWCFGINGYTNRKKAKQ